jgi:gluconate 2-dehydrogenase gamma chain
MVEPIATAQFLSRRSLLASTAVGMLVAAGVVRAETIKGVLPWHPGMALPPTPFRSGPWAFFTSEEASLVEAIVDRLIPKDELGPGAKDAGCAVFIDRQLAGAYGKGEGLYLRPPFMPGTATQGYQSPDAPAARYQVALKGLAKYIRTTFSGKSFQQLPTSDQDRVLAELEAGKLSLEGTDGGQFFALLLQNTQEGFFADPVYGGNRDMTGWKLIGFPGTRYDYRDWVERHNEVYPLPPVSIMGRPEWTIQE